MAALLATRILLDPPPHGNGDRELPASSLDPRLRLVRPARKVQRFVYRGFAW
jgi:hypothetical protein